MEERKVLQWHPGFSAALRITLHEEMKYLEMYEEYQLSRKPMQIDILIIKKINKVCIKKSIGKIFRTYNIIEYKSPNDFLSINDFYKAYGYTCFYQSNTDKIKEIDPELSIKENYWIQNLRTDLKAGGEIRSLMKKYEKNRKSKDYESVMDLITRANWKQMEEEKKMCDALKELFAEELKEADARGRAEGMEHGKIEGLHLAKQILILSAQGVAVEEIARKCGVTTEQVKEVLA